MNSINPDGILHIYAALSLVVFLCNLAPIFAPPTWSVLVFFLLTYEMRVAIVVIIGAISAGLGRFLLGHGTRLLRNYLPINARKNLYDAGRVFEENQGRRFGIIALFIVSPLPSAQLFEAAGLMNMNLLRLTLAFFSGRIITYTFYANSASQLKSTEFGELITAAFKSPYAWILQLFSIALIYLIAKIDWRKYLKQINS